MKKKKNKDKPRERIKQRIERSRNIKENKSFESGVHDTPRIPRRRVYRWLSLVNSIIKMAGTVILHYFKFNCYKCLDYIFKRL